MDLARLISVTEAAHRLGVTGPQVRALIDRGELVGIMESGELKLPADQPALEACETVTLSRPAVMSVLAAIELAKHRLGTVDYLDAAHQIMTSALARPRQTAPEVGNPCNDGPTQWESC